jgi:hypothetical protein
MRLLLLVPLLLLNACASSSAIDARTAYWQAFLARELAIGASGDRAMDVMRQAGLGPQQGTYVTVLRDGRVVSNCRDPKMAVTGKESSGVRGLFSRYDMEVTVCFAADGRVEKHYVGAWNQGF